MTMTAPAPQASDPAPEPPASSAPVAPAAGGQRTMLGFVPTRRVVELILIAVLGVGSGLLFWGSHFGLNMVHSQLSSQNITFPTKGSQGFSASEFPGLQRYAGQKVDNGPKAKAYANQFIAVHLKAAGGGKTYSELSTQSQQNPSDTKLAATVQTMFRGETLRGLLLYAWGWSVVSSIALYAAIGALVGFVIMLIVTIGDFIADPKLAATRTAA